ncbi:MAG: molecular chaperone [Roseiarcus sp.]
MNTKRFIPRLALAAMFLGGAGAAFADQLTVEPVLLEMEAPSASGILKLRNDQDVAVTAQTRVLRWTQVDGVEKLEQTSDVVSSPPEVTLAPKINYVVRVVRVSKQPVHGEESYRVLVDQLPSNPRLSNPTVRLLIRQSIPVFFRARQVSPPEVSWSLSRKGDLLFLNAANSGDERLRIASLRLQDASGTTLSFGNGLLGYVLGRSSMRWQTPRHPRNFARSGPVTLVAQTNKGALKATIK